MPEDDSLLNYSAAFLSNHSIVHNHDPIACFELIPEFARIILFKQAIQKCHAGHSSSISKYLDNLNAIELVTILKFKEPTVEMKMMVINHVSNKISYEFKFDIKEEHEHSGILGVSGRSKFTSKSPNLARPNNILCGNKSLDLSEEGLSALEALLKDNDFSGLLTHYDVQTYTGSRNVGDDYIIPLTLIDKMNINELIMSKSLDEVPELAGLYYNRFKNIADSFFSLLK